jgi:DNA helicase-2/ATP-dependent DNA helicase PcrA
MPEKKLNPKQLEAVNHGNGPLLIIAGAGTGKTTVITERVKRLITQKLAQPGEILGLTFTDKAAREMEDRIDIALPYGFTQMWIMTFHSFCDRILRDEGIRIGLNTGYKLITDTDVVSLFRRRLFDMDLDYFRPLGNPNKFISGMTQHFNRLRDEDISPRQYLDWTKSQPKNPSSPEEVLSQKEYSELARIFDQYQKFKIEENVLDFADLVSYTLKLFRDRPNVLGNYQRKFKYVLVDEYQDTNYAQNQIVNLLAGKHHNLTVVADDDQSIYRWRGAAISNVIQFKTTYPKAKLVVLTLNYRNTQEILDAAYRLIQFNNPDRLEIKEKITKKLKAALSKPGYPVEFLHFDRVENEADGVAKKIKSLLEENPGKYLPKDFAVLVRANAHAHSFSRSLDRLGIPYQFLGPGRLFEQPEVKDLIAYLRILRDPEDNQSLFRVLSMEYFAIPVRDLVTLGNYAQKHQTSFFTACEFPDDLALPQATKQNIGRVTGIINKHLALITKESAGQILFYFLQDTGLLSAILSYQTPLDEHKAGNITKFFNKLKSFETENKDASVTAVLDWIDLSTEVGESPAATDTDWTQNDAVNILTIHSAKGLEFPIVFLVNLVSQRFPTSEKKEAIPLPREMIREILPEGDFHLQEERRLFYVGMTRACERLFLTAADFYGEGKRIKKISNFVSEALGDKAIKNQPPSADQMSFLDWTKNNSAPPPQKPVPLTVNYLSYSQIQTFLDCPLHYKAKYLLKISSPPSAASSFGNTIHKTLKDYFILRQQGEKPDILKIFARDWIAEGYLNAKHAKSYFQKGERYLKDYLEINPIKILPLRLEDSFTVPIGELKIGGKIDRVDLLPDGILEIIDYKTSTKQLTAKQAAVDLQLSFYALAAHLIPYPPYHKSPDKIKLSLYYLDTQEKISVFQTQQQLIKAKEQIMDYKEQILHSDFHCSRAGICQGKCDYQILCDLESQK